MGAIEKTINIPEETDAILSFQCQTFDESGAELKLEYDILPAVDLNDQLSEMQQKIALGLASTDEQIHALDQKLSEINAEIDRLTNHADGIDYMVAVGSGILAGIIDAFFVEEFSLTEANKWGTEKVNNFVISIAQKQGYTGNDLYGAVKKLEEKFSIAADKVTNQFGGGRQHHLRDFSHHPTPVGLFFSLLTQFTRNVYGTDVAGVFQVVPLKESDWNLIGKNLPEKITFGVITWFFHMVSDMAGSTTTISAGKSGTGLPGPIGSLLKEVSALPIFRNTNEDGYKEFSVWISKLFNGTLLGKRDENGKLIEAVKFDLRTEIGVAHELGKQTIPVVINECVVRGFYFIRRLCVEIRETNVKRVSDLKNINWKNTLPHKNRTIARMLTISTGTMTAIDLADAAIRSAVKSGGVSPTFVSNFLLRVNFVGVGRFAIACGTDIYMGVQREHRRNERMKIVTSQLYLYNAKVFYKQADMWIAANTATESVDAAYELIFKASQAMISAIQDISKALDRMDPDISSLIETDPLFAAELLDELL